MVRISSLALYILCFCTWHIQRTTGSFYKWLIEQLSQIQHLKFPLNENTWDLLSRKELCLVLHKAFMKINKLLFSRCLRTLDNSFCLARFRNLWRFALIRYLFCTLKNQTRTALSYGGYGPHVALEHLKCDHCDWGTEFEIVFHFN